jgi:hypothetical protein
MENAASVLVLVVHPDEETIGFSNVGVGADVISATDGGRGGRCCGPDPRLPACL